MPTGNKKRQKGNPPVRTPRPAQGALIKAIRAKVKRLNRKPNVPRGR